MGNTTSTRMTKNLIHSFPIFFHHRDTEDTAFHRGNLKYILVVTTFCLFVSCDNNIVFSEFQPVKDKKWDKQDEFVFQFEMNDVSIPYNISLQLRNSRLYPYKNLFVILEELHPTEIVINDTIECMLADSTGKWTGNGITLFQNLFMLRNNYHLTDTGKYTIILRHAMVDEYLKGIEDVGVLVERVQPSFRPESIRRKINNNIVNPNSEEPP